MIRGVVFDFDGTIVDSNEIKRRAFFEATAAWDPTGAAVEAALADPDPGDRFDVLGRVARELAAAGAAPPGRSPEAFARVLAREYGRICEDAIAVAEEIPGALAALTWLRARGVPRFVSSATPEVALEPVVARRGLRPLFDAVYGRPASKLEHLGRIAGRTGAAPGELLLVGDGEDDRRAARGFGCLFAGVVRGPGGRFAAAPEHRMEDLRGLPALCERIGVAPAPERARGEARVAARGH
jgi:phosphoglycolate phosphatase